MSSSVRVEDVRVEEKDLVVCPKCKKISRVDHLDFVDYNEHYFYKNVAHGYCPFCRKEGYDKPIVFQRGKDEKGNKEMILSYPKTSSVIKRTFWRMLVLRITRKKKSSPKKTI